MLPYGKLALATTESGIWQDMNRPSSNNNKSVPANAQKWHWWARSWPFWLYEAPWWMKFEGMERKMSRNCGGFWCRDATSDVIFCGGGARRENDFWYFESFAYWTILWSHVAAMRTPDTQKNLLLLHPIHSISRYSSSVAHRLLSFSIKHVDF
jgi:hypothetical protein